MSMYKIIQDVLNNKPALAAAAVGVAGALWWRRVRARQGPRPPANWQQDVVYLHAFPRRFTKQVVNLSPYAMKVETWLRLHAIDYEFVETMERSPRRKQIPYVWFNGQWLEDSGLIIKQLTSYFKLDETEGLTEAERGVSLAFTRMIDSHTSWTIFYYRYYTDFDAYHRVMRMSESWLVRLLYTRRMKKRIRQMAWDQGIARYTEEERIHLSQWDVAAISDFLDNKTFMMGDKMTSVDCCVFAHLCQVVLVDIPYPHKASLKGKGQNLVKYVNRIKDQLWPDWEHLCDVSGRFQ